MDAAGHPYDKPAVVAGALVSTEEAWLRFEPIWIETLHKHGLEGDFHMTDFEREYRNSPVRATILADLIKVVAGHIWGAFASVVPMDAYRNVNQHYFLEEYAGKPYAIAVRGAYNLFQDWKELKQFPHPHTVFYEKGDLHSGDMVECFLRDHEPEPIRVTKKIVPTQAVDMFAWEVAYHHRTSLLRPSFDLMRTHFGSNACGIGVFNKRRLRHSMESTGLPLRKDAPPGFEVRYATSPKRKRLRQL